MARYLDFEGLSKYDTLLKEYISENFALGDADISYDSVDGLLSITNPNNTHISANMLEMYANQSENSRIEILAGENDETSVYITPSRLTFTANQGSIGFEAGGDNGNITFSASQSITFDGVVDFTNAIVNGLPSGGLDLGEADISYDDENKSLRIATPGRIDIGNGDGSSLSLIGRTAYLSTSEESNSVYIGETSASIESEHPETGNFSKIELNDGSIDFLADEVMRFYPTNGVEMSVGEGDETMVQYTQEEILFQTVGNITFNAENKTIFNGNVDFSNATVKGLASSGSNKLTDITYFYLKKLRDTSKLIPGMFYCITDYVCTTTQEGTRAMNNQFNIIVQALSANQLSENASAMVNKSEINKNYIIEEDVILSAIDKTLDSTKVTAFYEEFVDWFGDDYINTIRNVEITFVAYDYWENNVGKKVPVLFEFYNEHIDDEQPYFYVGTAEIDGVKYDKWRQIELVSDSDDTTNWETAAQKYIYTNTIVKEEIVEITNSNNATISDSVIYSKNGNGADQLYTGEDALIEGAVTIHYHVFEDYGEEEGKTDETNDYKGGDQFIAFGYEKNNEGITVPVLYKTDLSNAYDNPDEFGTPDYEDVFFYVGRETLFGTTYDKWRKIDTSDNGGTHDWDNGNYYVYTNIITSNSSTNQNSSYFANAKLNAWKLKYCLDNDTNRFAWADEANGKGVIYYMQDEHGNECPYDFKNIQFERDTAWQEEHSDFIESLGLAVDDVNWFYTFSWVNENLEVEDLTLRQDLLSDEALAYGTINNKIDILTAGHLNSSRIRLNSIIFINTWQFEEGFFYGCYNNSFAFDCQKNTLGHSCKNNKFAHDCSFNTIGNSVENNIFDHHCTFNTVGVSCSHNTFGNSCYDNKLANYCTSNRFEDNCNNIILENDSGNNVFEQFVGYCKLLEGTHNIRVCMGVEGQHLNPFELSSDSDSFNKTPTIYRRNGTKEIILD